MEKRIVAYMEEHQMTVCGDRVRVALSGGADSVSLLLLLNNVKDILKIRLSAVHVHHGLRAESDEEEAFVRKLCETRGIDLDCHRVDVRGFAANEKCGIEEAARILRYRIFDSYADAGEKIAVAHNMGDQAETVLFHLFRGTDLTGLAGIAPVRGPYIRPLLFAKKEELLSYLEKEKVSYVTDESNFDVAYARNRIRNRILPEAEEISEKAVFHIAQAAGALAEACAYLEEDIRRTYETLVERSDGQIRIKKEELNALPVYPAGRIVYEMIAAAGGKRKDISRVHVEAVCSLAKGNSGRKASLPNGLIAQSDQVYLRILKEGGKEKPHLGRIKVRSFPYEAGMGIVHDENRKWFDADRVEGELLLRTREEGDYFYVAPGCKQKLQDYFVNAKIPLPERETIPLLSDGKHIVWILGYRISALCRISDETKRVLEVTYEG